MIKLRIIVVIIFCLGFTALGYYQSSKSNSYAATLPTDTLLFDSNRTGNYEIFSLGLDGQTKQLTNNSEFDSWWPKPSPNGKKLVFYRTPKGIHDRDYTKTSLWAANIDGSNTRQIISNGANGWLYQGHAEWSPDSKNLVMFGKLGQLFITDSEGQNPTLVSTTNQNSAVSDPSFSPDGFKILYAYQQNIWRVSKSGGTPVKLTNDSYADYDPYYSPDGRQIALLTHTSSNILSDWAIRLVKSDGSNLRFFINDGNINSKPAWSLDGTKIYFHRHPNGAGNGYFGLWVQNLNGTGLAAIDAGAGSNEYPAVLYTQNTAPKNAATSNNPSLPTSSNTSPTAPPTSSTNTSNPSKQSVSTQESTQENSQTSKSIGNKAKNKNGLLSLAILVDIAVIIWLVFRLRKK